MTPPSSEQVAELLTAALDHAPQDRASFLTRACQGNEALLAEVRALLAAHQDAPMAFLASPMVAEVEGGDVEVTLKLNPAMRPGGGGFAAMSEAPGHRIGPYKLREQIGEGGFGVVWVAEQEQPVRRRVALKIVKLGMDTQDVIARFEQERQALALMDHPNIAKVLDAGATDSGRPFFVMELVRGVKITDYCDEKQLSTDERIDLFILVCQAVQHAHQKGIIHRDLKPSNILVTVNDGKAVPKVIDFGVAKATQGRLAEQTIYTQFQQMIGTPLYMSPEQADMTSLDVDTRSDIYSLGVLLYELLTGRTPIDEMTMRKAGLDEMRRMIREVEPPRPSMRIKTLAGEELTTMAKRRHTEPARLPSALRGDLDWIVMKCLEKDRQRRYDTANGLASDLRRHLDNEVITARPPTTGYLLGKLIRRNKLVCIAGAAIVASLFIGIVGTTFGLIRARQQRDLAEKATEAARLAWHRAEDNEKLAAASERRAAASAADARYQLTRLHVATGTQAQERGDPYTALLWYTRAWRGDPDPAHETAHRTRLGAVLNGMPRLAGVCFHGACVDDVEFDPTGRLLVTRTADRDGRRGNAAYLWDYTASKLAAPPLVHAGAVRFAGFSPDGSLILTASDDSTAALWSTATGRRLLTLDHGAPVVAAAFAPDGKSVATAAGTKVTFWNPATGDAIAIKLECPDLVYAFQYSVDGGRILTADCGGHARVWEAATGRVVGQPFANRVPSEGEESFFKPRPVLSPDGNRILTFGGEGGNFVEAHEIITGRLLWRYPANYYRLAWSSDGKQAIFVTAGTKVVVADSDTGKRLHEYPHPRQAPWAMLGPGGRVLVTAYSGGGICLWNAGTGESLGPPLQCTDFLRQLRFSPDGKHLIAGSQDGTARVWDLAQESTTVPYAFDCEQAHLGAFGGFSTSPDGRTRFLPDAQGGMLKRASLASPLRLEHAAAVIASRFSGDGRRLVTFAGRSLRVWDTASGEPAGPSVLVDQEFELPPELEISNNGRRMALNFRGRVARLVGSLTAKRPAALMVWEAGGRRLFTLPSLIESGARVFGEHSDEGRVSESAFSPDGRIVVAVVHSSGEMSAFDVDTGRRLYRTQVCRGHPSKPVFHPEGRSVVLGASDDIAREFDVFTGAPLGPPMRHPTWPGSVAINMERGKVATIGAGGRLRVWDARTGDVLVMAPEQAAVGTVCWFSRDGATVQFMQGKNWKRYRLPSCLGSQDAVSHAASLLTGRFWDASDSVADLGPNEFIEHRATYRKAWLDWLGLPDAPQSQP